MTRSDLSSGKILLTVDGVCVCMCVCARTAGPVCRAEKLMTRTWQTLREEMMVAWIQVGWRRRERGRFWESGRRLRQDWVVDWMCP